MKIKLVLLTIICFGFANAKVGPTLSMKNYYNSNVALKSIMDSELEYSNSILANENNDCPTVRISCSVTIDNGFGASITVTSSGGNWFTSPEEATLRCNRNLMHAIIDLAFNP